MADQQNEEETTDAQVEKTQLKCLNEHSGGGPSFVKGKGTEIFVQLLEKRAKKSYCLCKDNVNKDVDVQKELTGLQFAIENTKPQGELKEEKEKDASLKRLEVKEKKCTKLRETVGSKEKEISTFKGEVPGDKEKIAELRRTVQILRRKVDDRDSKIAMLRETEVRKEREITSLRKTINSRENINIGLQKLMTDIANKTTLSEKLASFQEKLEKRPTPADVLKPEPPRDGTRRNSNPASHWRHKTVPPSFFTERKVETKDQAVQVSSSESNCSLPFITLGPRTLDLLIPMIPNSTAVFGINLTTPTQTHEIVDAAAFPRIESSGTASVSTKI